MGRRPEAAISGPMFDLIGEVRRQHVSDERIRKVNESGLFAKLLKANVVEVDREALERVLGLAGPPQSIKITRCANIFKEQQLLKDHIGTWAKEMLASAELEALERGTQEQANEEKLILVSTKQLGIPGQFTYRQVLERGAAKGLRKCLVGDALALRRTYRLQPYGEHIRVVMEPIIRKSVGGFIFCLDCTDENGLMIDGVCGDLDREWDERENLYWVFRS